MCYFGQARTGNHKATTRGKHGSGTEAQKLKGGKQSLYLDIYHQGRRQYEFLRLYLERDNRAANKEVLRLAEQVRAKRQLELQSAKHGLVPAFKRKADFVEYFRTLEKNDRPTSEPSTC